MKRIVLILALALAGCNERINSETVNEAFRLCAEQDGLSSVSHDSDTFTAHCMNGRWFHTKHLPRITKKEG